MVLWAGRAKPGQLAAILHLVGAVLSPLPQLCLNPVKCLMQSLQATVVLTRGSPRSRPEALWLCRDRRKASSFGSEHLNLTPDTPGSLPHMLLDQSEAGFAHRIWRTGTVTLMLGVLVVSRTTLGRPPATKLGMKSTVCSLLQLAAGSPR